MGLYSNIRKLLKTTFPLCLPLLPFLMLYHTTNDANSPLRTFPDSQMHPLGGSIPYWKLILLSNKHHFTSYCELGLRDFVSPPPSPSPLTWAVLLPRTGFSVWTRWSLFSWLIDTVFHIPGTLQILTLSEGSFSYVFFSKFYSFSSVLGPWSILNCFSWCKVRIKLHFLLPMWISSFSWTIWWPRLSFLHWINILVC